MPVHLPALPFTLDWDGPEPPSWDIIDTGLEATAAAETDWYVYAIEPPAAPPKNGARLLGLAPEGDWQFSARVTVDFNGTYDAGTLLLHVDEDHWSKLCFEYSPGGQGMVVSVITRGTSDDANGWTVEGNTVWLRISRLSEGFVFHASNNGERWEFARSFAFGAAGPVRTGFGVQAPTGEGCKVTFDRIEFQQGPLRELRDGS